MSNILLPKPALGTPIAKGQLLSKGLVANFPFSDGRGDILSDFSLEKNHGTITEATWAGNALNFDGTGDYVETVSAKGLPTTAGSFSVWLTPQAGSGTIIEVSDGSSSDRVVLYFSAFVSGDNRLYIYVIGGGAGGANVWQLFSADTVIIPGQRQHLFATFDTDADIYKVYRNGLEITPTNTETATSPSGTNQINIGSYYNRTNEFIGNMEHVSIYNRILSVSEIVALYLNPNIPMQQPPIWLFTPPVVAGLTIPIAMHHYKQMQGVA